MDIIAQIGYSQAETWVARVYGDAKPARMEDILSLPRSGWMPVGTVNFCRAAMAHQGLWEPLVSTYPEALRPFLRRHIWTGKALQVRASEQRFFVKPLDHKVFTGFVWPDGGFDQYQFMSQPDDLPVWCSDVVSFVSEWRYYVCEGVIVGSGRYDDGPDDAPMPDMEVVDAMLNAYKPEAPAGYSMDVGVLDSGETALVEINDGWGSLGLYKGSCSPRDYLRLLEARWTEINRREGVA